MRKERNPCTKRNTELEKLSWKRKKEKKKLFLFLVSGKMWQQQLQQGWK
jgi:hypothetical protein